MNKKTMFQRLVENALDFLNRAVDDLDEHPKFSLISFYTAVELFVKARLMMEHWALVVTNKQEPDLEKFQKGDFQSVTLDLANERLTKIAKAGLTSNELSVFKKVGIHRNQMVHFFHVSSAKGEEEATRREVAKQQLTAWYTLHKILTGQWKMNFKNWQVEIARIDKRLRKQKDYLKVVFDDKAQEIALAKQRGSAILRCPSCGFKAQKHEKRLKAPYYAECLVCGFTDTCVAIKCDSCPRIVRFVNDGYATCLCGRKYDPTALADELTDHAARHIAAMDGDLTEDANCAECDGYHSVLRIDDAYFCTECFEQFDTIQFCGWCHEGNTGDMEHSSWNGCNHCDGRAGLDRD